MSLRVSNDVSIIIVNYNTFQMTCECIQSIYNFTKDISFELILVDNNSFECDPELFEKIFPNIVLIKSNANLGFSKGNNLGIVKAKGKYILLLNSDTLLKDNAIKTTYDYLEQHPKAGVVSVRLIFPDGKHQSLCQRFPSIRFQLFELLRLQKLFSKNIAGNILHGAFFDHKKNVKTDWVWGTFFMFRSEIITKLNGQKLNDTFFMYCEDMQWCWDIHQLGYEVHYFPEAEVIHYMGGSSGNKNQLMEQNNILFMKNNYNFIHRWFIEILSKVLKIKL